MGGEGGAARVGLLLVVVWLAKKCRGSVSLVSVIYRLLHSPAKGIRALALARRPSSVRRRAPSSPLTCGRPPARAPRRRRSRSTPACLAGGVHRRQSSLPPPRLGEGLRRRRGRETPQPHPQAWQGRSPSYSCRRRCPGGFACTQAHAARRHDNQALSPREALRAAAARG